MKMQLKFEELGMFALGIALFSLTEFSWWIFPALLLIPDISMTGYLFGNKKGALIYNFFHNKGVAAGFYIAGLFLNNSILLLAGIILFSHSALDRLFGYGFKYPDSFKNTHLGRIGKNANTKTTVIGK
jgi:hypothetical protein